MRRETALTAITGVAAGAGLGALVMYLLDPDRGRRRRALIRDQITHARNEAEGALKATGADLRNRSKGLVHEVGRRLCGGAAVGESPGAEESEEASAAG